MYTKLKIKAALIVLIMVGLACGARAGTVEAYMDEYGGNPDVYARILSENDCAALQAEFDQAEANLQLQDPGTDQYKWGLGYMAASDARMQTLSCY